MKHFKQHQERQDDLVADSRKVMSAAETASRDLTPAELKRIRANAIRFDNISHPVRALSCGSRHVRNLPGFPGVTGPALGLETTNGGWWRRNWRASLRLWKMRFGLVLGGRPWFPGRAQRAAIMAR